MEERVVMDERNRTSHAPRHGVRAGATAMLAVVLALAPPAGAATPEVLGSGNEAAARALGDHALRKLDGPTFSLSSLRGQVVVVNFWASWCAPCRKELPRLDALNAELAKSGGRVVAVSIDTDVANARRFVTAHKITMPVAQDGPDGLARILDLRHVPCTLVLDRDGSIACAVGGGDDAALEQVTSVARRLSGRTPVVAGGAGSEAP
jgi:thiol-disulfide isomerase/thioredoxin